MELHTCITTFINDITINSLLHDICRRNPYIGSTTVLPDRGTTPIWEKKLHI